MITNLTDNRLVYLDTGEIYEADDDGIATGDPVAILMVGILDDDAHALGVAMAAAPDLFMAASNALTVLEGIATIRRDGDAIDQLRAALAKAAT